MVSVLFLKQSIQLEIQPLSEKALADIESKVTSNNVVSEVFSRVTAG